MYTSGSNSREKNDPAKYDDTESAGAGAGGRKVEKEDKEEKESALVNEIAEDTCSVDTIVSNKLNEITDKYKQLIQLVQFEYHVLYSMSYEVPVVYFKANKSDGTYLDVESIWRNIPTSLLPSKYTKVTNQDEMKCIHSNIDCKYNCQPDDSQFQQMDKLTQIFGDVITQVDHPFLSIPFFMLHPCGSRHLLSQVDTLNEKKDTKIHHSDIESVENPFDSSASSEQLTTKQEEEIKYDRLISQQSYRMKYQTLQDQVNCCVNSSEEKSTSSASCDKSPCVNVSPFVSTSCSSLSGRSSSSCLPGSSKSDGRKKRSILLTCLSSLGPSVGLKIDPAYALNL